MNRKVTKIDVRKSPFFDYKRLNCRELKKRCYTCSISARTKFDLNEALVLLSLMNSIPGEQLTADKRSRVLFCDTSGQPA